jgi:pyrimidine deaminase RibD-like protein
MDFSSPRDTINAISQHLRTTKPYAGAQFRLAFLGDGAEQFLTGAVVFRDQHVASRAPETYRQGDRKFLFIEHWCREQWEAVTLLSKLLSGQAEIEGRPIKATFSRSEFSHRTYPSGRDWWTGYELRSRRDRDENWRELHVPQGDLVRRGASPYQGPDHAIDDWIFNQDTYNLPGADLPSKDTIVTMFPDSRARILSADWQPQQKKLYLEVELKVPPEQIELRISHIESKDRSQSIPLKSGRIEVDIPEDASSLSIYLLDHSDNIVSHFDLDGYNNRFGKADPNAGRPLRGRTVFSDAEIVFDEPTGSGIDEGFFQLNPRTNDDRQFMKMAIDEARKSRAEDGRSHPKVGAVVVKDGRVLARAHRGEISGCHAEYIALEKKLADQSLAGATVYTTLEPCTSRNDPKIPCATRLIDRKVARVVIGTLDPNSRISGRGQRALRKANIETDFFPHDLMAEIEELNREFTRQQESHEQPSTPTAKEPNRFFALEELAGQLVEELSSYRPLDGTALVPWFDEFRRAPGRFVRYPEVRTAVLDLQNVLDRMFVAKRDREDGQSELRAELDAALKALLAACDRADEKHELPPKCPKIRPVSYDRESEKNFAVGLILANDGEPAYDIFIPDIQLNQFRIKFVPHFTRLSKEDGSKSCEVSIQNPGGTLFTGEALFDVMRSQNVSAISVQIRFSDSDSYRYVVTCKLQLETVMVGGTAILRIMARFERQEKSETFRQAETLP